MNKCNSCGFVISGHSFCGNCGMLVLPSMLTHIKSFFLLFSVIYIFRSFEAMNSAFMVDNFGGSDFLFDIVQYLMDILTPAIVTILLFVSYRSKGDKISGATTAGALMILCGISSLTLTTILRPFIGSLYEWGLDDFIRMFIDSITIMICIREIKGIRSKEFKNVLLNVLIVSLSFSVASDVFRYQVFEYIGHPKLMAILSTTTYYTGVATAVMVSATPRKVSYLDLYFVGSIFIIVLFGTLSRWQLGALQKEATIGVLGKTIPDLSVALTFSYIVIGIFILIITRNNELTRYYHGKHHL